MNGHFISMYLDEQQDKIIAELIQIHENKNTLKPYKIRGFEVFLQCARHGRTLMGERP